MFTASPSTATTAASPKATWIGWNRRSTDSTPMPSATMPSTSAEAKPARSPTLPVPKL